MPRVKRSVHARKKRRKVLEEAKGYWGLKKSNYTYAKEQVERSLAYAYRDRKVRKREFRRLWIMRINAGARANGLSYNQFIAGLKAANVELDRKVLADLAIADPAKFGEIVEQAKAALAQIDARRQRRDLPAAGRLLRRPLAAVRPRLPPARRRSAGRRHRTRPRAGTCRCACSAGCTTSCSAARRRGTTLGARARAARVPRRCVRRAGGADERGAARPGRSCPAFLSLADGRPFDLLELGPSAGLNLVWDRYALPLLDRRVGERSARARRRRPHPAAGGAARAARRGCAAARDRPEPRRHDDRRKGARAAGVRLGGPGRSGSSACDARSRSRGPTRRS